MPSRRSPFFAYLNRLRWIKRWSLMRNAIDEDVATHSWEVAMLAHALAEIHNQLHPNSAVNAYRIATAGIYHDATEVITGDLPTPVKYHSHSIQSAFKDIERKAESELVALLPENLQATFAKVLKADLLPEPEQAILKAADRLSAYLKCLAEQQAGNQEFSSAARETRRKLEESSLDAVQYFIEHFLPGYECNLDHLLAEKTE